MARAPALPLTASSMLPAATMVRSVARRFESGVMEVSAVVGMRRQYGSLPRTTQRKTGQRLTMGTWHLPLAATLACPGWREAVDAVEAARGRGASHAGRDAGGT